MTDFLREDLQPASVGRVPEFIAIRERWNDYWHPFSCGTGGISQPLSGCLVESPPMIRAVIALLTALMLQGSAAARTPLAMSFVRMRPTIETETSIPSRRKRTASLRLRQPLTRL